MQDDTMPRKKSVTTFILYKFADAQKQPLDALYFVQ
jgi:hypothetical protein